MNNLYRTLSLLGAAATASMAGAVQFTVTVTNLGPQPLAPVFFATSNSSFDIFTVGTSVSAAVELLAEEGDPAGLLAAATAAGSSVMSSGATTGPFMAGDSRVFTMNADTAHPWFSFASMLGATNDGFIGSALGNGDGQINLFQGGQPLEADFTVSFLDVWDAGTEVNTELMAHIPAFGNHFVGPTEGGVLTQPHEGITGRGDVPLSLDWYGHDVAHITITAVPEPATMFALLASAGVIAAWRRRNLR